MVNFQAPLTAENMNNESPNEERRKRKEGCVQGAPHRGTDDVRDVVHVGKALRQSCALLLSCFRQTRVAKPMPAFLTFPGAI
jgi:hypothetical protein